MKFRKALSIILSIILLMTAGSIIAGAEERVPASLNDGKEALLGQFEYGIGPETEGYAIDYRYYSPVGENDDTKYPLVIWLHGMGDGEFDGKQISAHDASRLASAELQSRFTNGGAYIFAPRSLEEKELYWADELIVPVRAAIDDFIAKNSNVDVSRIYVGGYSMGGKMTLKMAVAYPEMFAAAFPICPAWVPGTEATAKLSDMPIWLTSSAADPTVGYFTWVMPTWKNLISTTNKPENCRFSTLSVVCYPNGVPVYSSHFSWYAVTNDMFSYDNGDYPLMKTVDGNGEKVILTYPDGMISWLCSFTSDYDGAPAADKGNAEARGGYGVKTGFALIGEFIKNFIEYIFSSLKMF